MSINIYFAAHFTTGSPAAKKTGLTVTVDVFAYGSGTKLVTAGSASEEDDGLYYYTYASGTAGTYYHAVFHTADATVNAQDVPSLGDGYELGYIDAALSGLSTLNAAGVRTAVGLASANLDTQLSGLSTLNAAGVRSAVGLASANLDTQLSALTPLNAAGVRSAVGLASANLDTQLSAIPTTASLDAAGVRVAVGLATANLDTQLSGLSTLNAAGVRTAVGLASANLDTQLSGLTPLNAAGVRSAVGLASANLDTQLSAIPTTASLDAAGVRGAVGLASANLDTQLSGLTPLNAAGVRSAVGLASANLDTQLSAIIPLDAAGVRGAVGLAAANLDAQLSAISSGVDPLLNPVPGAYVAGTAGWVLGNLAGGAGSVKFVYHVTTPPPASLPIDDVLVRVTSDATGDVLVAQGETDVFGNVTFYLNPGTYYLWRQKAHHAFVNPDVEVVT